MRRRLRYSRSAYHDDRRMGMSGELAGVASEFIAALDSLDVDGMMAQVAEGAQGVDELSRRWIRGRAEIDSYLRGLVSSVGDLHTELADVTENVWGETGVLTCWLDQRYTLDGQAQHVSAPTTIVFRREGGGWKLALFHSVPLPEE
jgi:ketosteroid isomerase-like protein